MGIDTRNVVRIRAVVNHLDTCILIAALIC